MNETELRRTLPEQSSGSGHTFDTPHHPSVIDPILSKRVCFYKSGDPQFNGLRMVINNRTFKSFDALLDNLSKKVPLPFGVRNITTPRGVHGIHTLDELEDGKSYICSDSRKVKPINLALARKKLPPWYHARPVSSRRQVVQQARFFPGQNMQRQESVAMRTPRKLVVYRNGDPSVKHTVVLHKKTTPNYESILEYISELMQFHVVKLYTPDGRRVDGLPGLILSSGTVVAVGRESFRPAMYSAQKSPAPTRQHANPTGFRKQKALNRKKKPLSYLPKSRNFSASSERYIVHQINNTIAESSCELPTHPTNSFELDSNRLLESVAETEGDTCLGDGADGRDCSLPSEDNIEKSFRVNQDGSMTVEMKVRLTIKEEETVHWTTTLTRSNVADLLNATCLPEPEAEKEICASKSNSHNSQSPAASVDTIKDKNKDNNDDDDDPPSLGNGAFSDSSHEEDDIKRHTGAASPRRAQTPGYRKFRKQQASVESIKSVTADGIQEGMMGSYSCSQQTENGTMTEQYCMVKQSTTRPVPMPRKFSSADANKSLGNTEMLQNESSGEEVTETVIHIYEQQTCQDNYFANVSAHSMSASGVTFGRPATSETGQHSLNNDLELELLRPSTASESISIWRAENMSITADTHLPSVRAGAIQNLKKGQPKPQQKEVSKDRVSLKPKLINKHVRRGVTPVKKPKENSGEAAEIRKKAKTFSSAGFIKRIYGPKSKSTKSIKKQRKIPSQVRETDLTTMSSPVSDNATETSVRVLNMPSVLKEKMGGRVSATELSPPRVVLTKPTSMHTERKSKKGSNDLSEGMPLPAFNSSSSVTKEYVESWLEKAHPNTSPFLEEEHRKLEEAALARKENGKRGESEKKHGVVIEAEDVDETSEMQTCLASEQKPECLVATSVKLRIQSMESKSSPTVEKTASPHKYKTASITDKDRGLSQRNAQEVKSLSNGISSEIIPPTTETSQEMVLAGEVEKTAEITFEEATLTDILLMELPPPPPELLNSDYCSRDVSSVGSSPLYRLSPVSSQRSGCHELSMCSTSDNVKTPNDNPMEKSASAQTDIPSTQQGAELSRTPSIKRAPLLSNLSLERKMSLKKACLDRYTTGNDATAEMTSLSTSINTGDDEVLPRGNHSTPQEDTQQSVLGLVCNSSVCTSLSPVSLTSDERMSSTSISSSEASFKETKTIKAPQKEAASPKTPVKRAKPKGSPSPERKFQNRKSPAELQSNTPMSLPLQSRPLDKAVPNISIQRHATPNHSPSTERKQNKPKVQQISSPYSQSLDMGSPSVKHKSSRKVLSRNLSIDNPSEPTSRKQKKTSSQTKGHQTPASGRSTAELGPTLTSETLSPLEADKTDENKVLTADLDNSERDVQTTPQHFNTSNQPNMKPILEKLCYSIKSIRQITQSKRPSCLEKSNSLPDFSSHVASTFGSSSKALLAFLAVMTLKEGLTNLNVEDLNANNVSCAEALKMIDSLKEIASIEDSQKLKTSLTNLQQSASKQLLESWKDFQELSERCTSRSSTPNASEHELITVTGLEQDCGNEENAIDEIMDNLDIPEKLKEELVSLSDGATNESDNEEEFSARIGKRPELSANQHSHEKTKNFPTEDAVSQNDKANTDVRSIIKKLTDVNQPKQPGMDCLNTNTEAVKHKPSGLTTNDKNSRDWPGLVTECPPAEPNSKQIPEDRQLYSTLLDLQSCRDVVHKEHQETKKHQQGQKDKTLTHERENMSERLSSYKNLEKDNLNIKNQDAKCRQLQMQSEKSIPENELTHDEKADEKGQMSSANSADLNEKESCEQSSEAGEEYSSDEEEAEVACEERKHESSEGEDMSKPERESEKENKQPGTNYVEVNVRGKNSILGPCRENLKFLEKQPKIECKISKRQHQSQNVSTDKSTENSNQPSSEEKQSAVPCKKLQAIAEESLSGNEEEQEEESFNNLPKFEEQTKKSRELEALIEEPEEDQVSSEEDLHNDEPKSQSTLHSSLIIADSLEKGFRFNTDDDSGNDHSSCEEQVDEEQLQVEDGQTSSSIEAELSYYEKESISEEEQAIDIKKSYTQHREVPVTTQPERVVVKLIEQSEEILTQSVAERVILLEKQVADAQKAKTTPQSIRRFSRRKATLESDEEDTPFESPTSEGALCTRSAPQSSLSFSYDSSGVITTEPESSRVRSIREMFMAKSTTDIQQRQFPSSNSSEQSELRPGTSGSGGYQSQTSSELSSGEDDSTRKSITKGFVRRTIERLYGKKDTNTEEACERPPSEPNQRRKEHPSIFSPFHAAQSKAMSEMSYFNSTNALDVFNEATRCIAFNAQVAPGDSIPIDNGRWLLKENTLIRKSVSDPVGINKTFTNSSQDERLCEDTEDNTLYSLFSTKPELEEKVEPLPRKCTYFSLPHASESEVFQDEVSTVSKSSENGDSVTEARDNSEDTKTWAERNGMLPSVGSTDFKIKDNKVHPLIELPPDGEVVVVQPGKGQAIVHRRLQEPDVLDLLYNFCGEHCPIL